MANASSVQSRLRDGMARSGIERCGVDMGVYMTCEPDSMVSSVSGRGSHAAVNKTTTAAAANPIVPFIVGSPNQVAVPNPRLSMVTPCWPTPPMPGCWHPTDRIDLAASLVDAIRDIAI